MEDPQHPQTEGEELVPRSPSVEDLLKLCSHLNDLGANYVVIGGFAIRGAGYPRETHDIDFVIATDLENEAKVYAALATLPDQAVLELQPGEVSQHTVSASTTRSPLIPPPVASITKRPRRTSSSGKSTASPFLLPRPAFSIA